MTRQLIILSILLFLASCTASYYITVKHDGSASVKMIKDYDPKVVNSFYQSRIISNIDTTADFGNSVSFEIKNIDSLGNYMPFPNIGFFKFNLQRDTLSITDGHTQVLKQKVLLTGFIITIKFENDIQSIILKGSARRKKVKRTVIISKTHRQLIKNTKKINVKIITKGTN